MKIDTLKTYEASIDHGTGGTATIQATTIGAAMGNATEWAKRGDYTKGGCEVLVSVERRDAAGEIVEEDGQRVKVGRKDGDR